jgi:hypothetical protein
MLGATAKRPLGSRPEQGLGLDVAATASVASYNVIGVDDEHMDAKVGTST